MSELLRFESTFLDGDVREAVEDSRVRRVTRITRRARAGDDDDGGGVYLYI